MENTPNRFEELDKLEEKKNNLPIENKPKQQGKPIKTLLSIVCVIIGIAFGYLLTSGKLFPPKDKVFEVMNEINKIKIKAPVLVGDVIISNVLNLGVDIVATRDVKESK